ncbi:hypothetical protein LPY66_11980 [Dehalobacter sp. DCM]|uniref:hypothetical protein n=1 Tax=Dehalobacter sp. DCM TaxID=2907827 RepID=UPI003081A3EE|nr:hypothetical protein LPY66_11980 [Dehalobacter sp. DCM]
MLFLTFLALEMVLLCAAGSSLIWNTLGIVLSGVILSCVHFVINPAESFWLWEAIIITYMGLGLAINALLNRYTHNFRLLKVVSGSGVPLVVLGVFVPLLPAALLWSFFVGIPLLFTYRSVSKFVLLQLIFRFIFSAGWLIIGNIL